IVAVKGLGGFHLMVDARNDDAVRLLRRRKRREEKPFALMVPWAHGPEALALRHVEALCHVSELEARLLRSAESPIVLLRKRADSAGALSEAVAPPPNPYLGVMLPYTPLHHLLMDALGFPVVATSGNLSDEPICIDEQDALERLAGIADLFLVHNRPIARHVDDSIVRVMGGREAVLRRARGYAPLPIRSSQRLVVRSYTTDDRSQITDHRQVVADVQSSIVNRQSKIQNPKSVLAVGAHLKNTVAISIGDNVFISQHIGDLETTQAYEAFCHVIDSLSALYEWHPDMIACDLHPDYLSTRFAETYAQQHNLPLIRVQHHMAHVAACMAENDLAGPALGVAWDGTGYGLDGTIWGGEFLWVPSLAQNDESELFTRVASLRPFRLPGGDLAIKEPRRVAMGVLYEMLGDAVWEMEELQPVAAFAPAERALVRQMLKQNVNAPVTTSAGRLFDAVAALAGLRQRLNYEGQAAMELEFAISDLRTDESYPFSILDLGIADFGLPAEKLVISRQNSEGAIQTTPSKIQLDWAPLMQAVIDDARAFNRQSSIVNRQLSVLAARFHNTLVEMIVAVARRVNEPRVILTGGCFQNRYLLERAIQRLRDEGFRPYWHQRVPPNDGGIALGQVAIARATERR
ncbi:MAG: carbamoyltransferase HypF, partial [Candidatus Roseilinea sp.]|uniref:carbamoyltransferase HypF n=1 Tax=Candidatus Roseilinea sp. TaxID=2838777 RepID=UPI00404A4C0D